jgi:hypothetical protein
LLATNTLYSWIDCHQNHRNTGHALMKCEPATGALADGDCTRTWAMAFEPFTAHRGFLFLFVFFSMAHSLFPRSAVSLDIHAMPASGAAR